MPMRRGWIAPVAFMASCAGFLPPAMQLSDPLTHRAVDHEAFPVVLVSGTHAWVTMAEDPYNIPPPPAGASCLVPLERRRTIEQSIQEQDTRYRDRAWELNVEDLAAGRQRIELFLLGDGYWGGAYEAASTTIAPLYRKSTGPGGRSALRGTRPVHS